MRKFFSMWEMVGGVALKHYLTETSSSLWPCLVCVCPLMCDQGPSLSCLPRQDSEYLLGPGWVASKCVQLEAEREGTCPFWPHVYPRPFAEPQSHVPTCLTREEWEAPGRRKCHCLYRFTDFYFETGSKLPRLGHELLFLLPQPP